MPSRQHADAARDQYLATRQRDEDTLATQRFTKFQLPARNSHRSYLPPRTITLQRALHPSTMPRDRGQSKMRRHIALAIESTASRRVSATSSPPQLGAQ